ncbi:hypothetical protein [Derxia lacustris]|uniref:hypothetical protein n=1 Tax=Derxia lacustris TaxID=764842 RepID=UPI00111BE1E6|nr:hypothetical protein [Derxia lacustris]
MEFVGCNRKAFTDISPPVAAGDTCAAVKQPPFHPASEWQFVFWALIPSKRRSIQFDGMAAALN